MAPVGPQLCVRVRDLALDAAFYDALAALIAHAKERQAAVATYLMH